MGNHEPRDKRDAGTPMCPNWVRSEIAKMLNQLSGEHDEVLVAAAALLGPHGYDVQACEQTTNFDPNDYGPIMLEGYCMIAGIALAKTLDTVYAATSSEQHFTQSIENQEQRLQEMRNLYEQAVRQFLESALTFAGGQFQQDKPSDLSVAAGSQLIGLWQQVARSTIKFHATQEETDHDAEPGTSAGSNGPEG